MYIAISTVVIDIMVSSVCFDVLRRQVNFSNKIVMHINLLYPVSAGPIRSMDNNFVHKFVEKEWRQLRRFGVLLYDFQKTLDVDFFRFHSADKFM